MKRWQAPFCKEDGRVVLPNCKQAPFCKEARCAGAAEAMAGAMGKAVGRTGAA